MKFFLAMFQSEFLASETSRMIFSLISACFHIFLKPLFITSGAAETRNQIWSIFWLQKSKEIIPCNVQDNSDLWEPLFVVCEWTWFLEKNSVTSRSKITRCVSWLIQSCHILTIHVSLSAHIGRLAGSFCICTLMMVKCFFTLVFTWLTR